MLRRNRLSKKAYPAAEAVRNMRASLKIMPAVVVRHVLDRFAISAQVTRKAHNDWPPAPAGVGVALGLKPLRRPDANYTS